MSYEIHAGVIEYNLANRQTNISVVGGKLVDLLDSWPGGGIDSSTTICGRLHTVHQRDRQTDGRTHERTDRTESRYYLSFAV